MRNLGLIVVLVGVCSCGGSVTGGDRDAGPGAPPSPAPGVPPGVPDAGPGAPPSPAPPPPTNSPVATIWTEDATRIYYDTYLELSWAHNVGDWRDASDTPQGTQFFASFIVAAASRTDKLIEFDVTTLVQKYGADFAIRTGGATAHFHSREEPDVSKRPALIVTQGGTASTLTPKADTALDASAANPATGTNTELALTAGVVLVRFDQPADMAITQAKLQLTASWLDPGTIGIYRPDPHPVLPNVSVPANGTAADIVFDIKGEGWKTAPCQGLQSDRQSIDALGNLLSTIPTGQVDASSILCSIPRASRRETMFLRNVMRIEADWDEMTGGKFPGITNTHQLDYPTDNSKWCGWGGRDVPSNPNAGCWSARTNRQTHGHNEFTPDFVGFGPYAYRFNQTTGFGEGPYAAYPLPRRKYFVYDQMVVLNTFTGTIPNADGKAVYWLNGVPVVSMDNVIWRTRVGDDTLPSEVWVDIYEGGTTPVTHPYSATEHEVILSTKLLPYDPSVLAALNR